MTSDWPSCHLILSLGPSGLHYGEMKIGDAEFWVRDWKREAQGVVRFEISAKNPRWFEEIFGASA